MSALTLLRHGQRVRPEYEAMPSETEGAMGSSSTVRVSSGPKARLNGF